MKAIKSNGYSRQDVDDAFEKSRQAGVNQLKQMILRIVALSCFETAKREPDGTPVLDENGKMIPIMDQVQVGHIIDQIGVYTNRFIDGTIKYDEVQETLQKEFDFLMLL